MAISDYKQDPNNSKKQVPKGRADAIGHPEADVPDINTLVKRADKVFVKNFANDIHFAFSSASFAAGSWIEFPSGSAQNEGLELNIQPVAWSGSSAAGSVIFYRNGRR